MNSGQHSEPAVLSRLLNTATPLSRSKRHGDCRYASEIDLKSPGRCVAVETLLSSRRRQGEVPNAVMQSSFGIDLVPLVLTATILTAGCKAVHWLGKRHKLKQGDLKVHLKALIPLRHAYHIIHISCQVALVRWQC